jgi:hypothetical protein
MCPESNIYAPCRGTGSLPLPVKFGGALNLFLPVIARRRKPMLTRLALCKSMLMWVPRAAASLARLWLDQGKRDEARNRTALIRH